MEFVAQACKKCRFENTDDNFWQILILHLQKELSEIKTVIIYDADMAQYFVYIGTYKYKYTSLIGRMR